MAAQIRRAVLFSTIAFCSALALAEVKPLSVGGFTLEQELALPASPEAVYDAVTGDVSGWWDHSFSKQPAWFYLDAKPGGGFWEFFDKEGKNGVLHATVIYADRGKRLTFRGPLGFNGKAVDCVMTYDLKPEGSGTRLHLTVNATGQTSAEEGKLVDGVWHHFLFERLKPYIESGEYLKKAKKGKR